MPSATVSGGNTTVVIRGGNTQRIVQDRRTVAAIEDHATIVKTTGGVGVQGAPGTGILMLGVFNSLAALIAVHPIGSVGDTYAIAGDLVLWDVTTNAWANAGPFRGPEGDPGQIRFTGNGEPTTIIGSRIGDTYLDLDTGIIYTQD